MAVEVNCQLLTSYLIDVLVSLDKIDAELPQRGGGGITECKRYSSLHRLDVG